ncbi:Putative DNA-binding protein ESCAROLA [Apostasia shenzhenica]|uniref:AT-hook motif nuclear-localized protein n=1 Tax=Apostasia shenzhenica TaxID=1088818 RepID=A0A2I0BEN4_9ASPA|nr:Putative DNA-binding protein ESCAROLA [Apostasia shenzhenica]
MDSSEPSRLASSEPSGMLGNPTSYGSGAGVPGGSMVMANSAGMVPGLRLPFNSIGSGTLKSLDVSDSLFHGDGVQGMRPGDLFNMGEPLKKKRGRPRKYGPEGTMALALRPMSSTSGYSKSSMSDPTGKRRGRPPGSGKKQQLDALGSAGTAFTPHVITVNTGEIDGVDEQLSFEAVVLYYCWRARDAKDVASKIMSFSQQGPRTICILSANGAISNVTLRQQATSGGTVTYEDRFEIISLSGSYLPAENDGTRSRTGGLSVALAGSDGRVLGGVVVGMLKAATPVQAKAPTRSSSYPNENQLCFHSLLLVSQVVVGSFMAQGKKAKPDPLKHELSSAPSQIPGFGAPSTSTPPSQDSLSDSDDDQGSPINHNTLGWNNSGHHLPGVPSYSGWSHSGH